MIILALICAFAIHESGHYLAALCFWDGQSKILEFRFAWGKYYVPRYVWEMPDVTPWKQKAIAISGFGAEILAALLFWAVGGEFWQYYAAVALLHLILYRFYAGEENDFKWLDE